MKEMTTEISNIQKIEELPSDAVVMRPVDIEDDEFVYYTGIEYKTLSDLQQVLKQLELADCLSGEQVIDILSADGSILCDFPFGDRGLSMLSQRNGSTYLTTWAAWAESEQEMEELCALEIERLAPSSDEFWGHECDVLPLPEAMLSNTQHLIVNQDPWSLQ